MAKRTISSIILFIFFTAAFFAETKIPVCTKIGTYKCGKQPKQVLFSPDERFIILPLLDDDGFDVFDLQKKSVVKRIKPPQSKKLGFAEGLFITEKNAFFVSQMTTGMVYEYTADTFEFKRSIDTTGTWSKFMVWNADNSILAVSNWVSNDISIIDYESGTVLRKIKTAAAPRGLAFVDEGNAIISLAFDGGKIQKFSTADGKEIAKIEIPKAAMRHIVLTSDEKKAYVSDMYHFKVYGIDLSEFKIKNEIKVFNNPNTIDILDDRFIFASSRGPNNPKDYTLRSPVNGKISVIDAVEWKLLYEIEGGNQPTGLDVSPSGKILCFSNFQDATIELYKIE